jgi:anaerobic selenocysteine-containing dehydrogenase
MGVRQWFEGWPVYRQFSQGDALGRGAAVKSDQTGQLVPRTTTADAVVKSVCPYRAVGCGQNVHVRNGSGSGIGPKRGDHEVTALLARGYWRCQTWLAWVPPA